VIALIVRETGARPERVVPKARFVEDLDLDELDMIELVMALEKEFGMEVSDEDFEGLVIVADAVEFVRTHTRS
jgi:acyl carrier protein